MKISLDFGDCGSSPQLARPMGRAGWCQTVNMTL